MKFFKEILSFFTNNNTQENKGTLHAPSKELIYDKLIPISNTDTEGRQKIIKKLLKDDDIPLNDDIYQEALLCECDIKETDFESKSKILEVFVIDDYNYTVGYITSEYKELFNPELHNNTHYSTTLYVTKENNLYKLDLGIQFYRDK